MRERMYRLLLSGMIAFSIGFCILLGVSLALPRESHDYPNEAITNTAKQENTEAPVKADSESEIEADTRVDYLSIFFEGMSNVEVHDTISSAGLSKIYDWHLSFVTNGSDRFCLIQNYDTLPDCPVSRISVYSVQSPTENDLDVLVPGKSITEITEVWGCPTRNIPQSNFSIARFEYDLQDGKTVFMEYTYDKETGTHFLSWYRIHD